MPEYDGAEWKAVKGDLELEVTRRHMVDIWVSCTENVQVLGVPGTPGTSAVVLRSGKEFRFRGPVKNFQKIVVRGTDKVPFGVKVLHSPRQDGEPLSDERPPVIDLGQPSNLVLQMRRLAAENARFSRMPVLEPEDDHPYFNRYELDDDAEAMFEEEEYLDWKKKKEEAKKAAEEKKRDEEAKGRKEPVADDPPAPKAKPAEPPKAKSEAESPPPAKAAE